MTVHPVAAWLASVGVLEIAHAGKPDCYGAMCADQMLPLTKAALRPEGAPIRFTQAHWRQAQYPATASRSSAAFGSGYMGCVIRQVIKCSAMGCVIRQVADDWHCCCAANLVATPIIFYYGMRRKHPVAARLAGVGVLEIAHASKPDCYGAMYTDQM